MSNSNLVSYTRISPNKNHPRNHAIDTVTIHCIVGQWTAKQGCDFFSNPSRECSANYVVGRDGSIGLCVDEGDRSWCSSSRHNDNRAITIEVASDTFHPYAVTDQAMEALIKLLVDICQRNGIPELRWKADKNLIGHPDQQNMTVHRWFANKACPGEYLYSRHGQIAAEVNRRLSGGGSAAGGGTTPVKPEKPTVKPGEAIRAGSVVSIADDATYFNSNSRIPGWVRKKKWIVKEVSGNRAVIDKSVDGKNAICSPVHTKYLTAVDAPADDQKEFEPFLVKVTADVLNIRAGAGTNFPVRGSIRDHGVYTIIDQDGSWGKLKSGAGWIYLEYTKKI